MPFWGQDSSSKQLGSICLSLACLELQIPKSFRSTAHHIKGQGGPQNLQSHDQWELIARIKTLNKDNKRLCELMTETRYAIWSQPKEATNQYWIKDSFLHHNYQIEVFKDDEIKVQIWKSGDTSKLAGHPQHSKTLLLVVFIVASHGHPKQKSIDQVLLTTTKLESILFFMRLESSYRG